MIFFAETFEAKNLTEITLKSKKFWGYSEKKLENWTDELTVSEQMIQKLIVYKYIYDDKIIGFYILNQPQEKFIELEFLFVLPAFI